MPCEKKSFDTLRQAQARLAEIKLENAETQWVGREPVRAYQCPHCFMWHLTSMSKSQSDGNLKKALRERKRRTKRQREGQKFYKIKKYRLNG